MKIMLGAQSYQGRSKAITGQRLVNLYAEPSPEGSKYPFALYNTPGLVEWCDLGTDQAIQGMQVMDGLLYAISGNEVYKIDDQATPTFIDSITGLISRVDLANNGSQMTATTIDEEGFVITSSTVAQITDIDFPAVTSTTFLDGYSIFSKAASGQFNISDLYDATAYDALDFATAEETPDDLLKVYAFSSALWLFGYESYEVFYNSGNADFPFEQIPSGANTTRGLGAKFSVCQDDNTLFFVGNDRIVYKAVGYSVQRISTFAVEKAMQRFSSIADAFSFVYTQDGHKFLVITYPTGNATWAMDIATGLWHERTTLVEGSSDRWRANCFANFAGKQLVGDFENGKIYYMDPDVYDEDGEAIERIAAGPSQWMDGARITFDRVHLDIDAGVGLASGQGEDPMVAMRYSDDGGNTWSNEKVVSIGKIGEYYKKAYWRRLGTSRQRIFEFKITDPVRVAITGCYGDVRIGTA